METIPKRASFEVGQKPKKVVDPLIEFDAYFFFKLISFVFNSLLHISRPSIIYVLKDIYKGALSKILFSPMIIF